MTQQPPTPRPRLTRRDFHQQALAVGLGWLGLSGSYAPVARAAEPGERPSTRALEKSEFAYVSPLLRNGRESTCHAELWYAWLDDAVVVTVARDRWKARAVAKGLDRARIWIGNHGRWKTWYGGRNEDFRRAPSFVAQGKPVPRSEGAALLERLLAIYEEKYPAEIADWRDGMRSGQKDGSRVLLRYTPLS